MNKTIIISGTWEEIQEKLNMLKKKCGADTPISVFIGDLGAWIEN